MGFWRPNLERIASIPKAAGIGALLAGGAVALPFIVGGLRKDRSYDEDNAPIPKELSDPLPQVLELPPLMPQQQPPQPMMGQTMMGMQPVKGDFVKRLEMQRSGLGAGIDPSAPSIMSPDGRNVIDGSGKIQELNLPGGRGA